MRRVEKLRLSPTGAVERREGSEASVEADERHIGPA